MEQCEFSRLTLGLTFATIDLRLAGATSPGRPLLCKCPLRGVHADRQSAGPERQGRPKGEGQDPCSPRRAAEAGRVHACHDADAEEAQLGSAQGCPRAADERDGSRGLHSRRGAQPAGALGRARPRRSRQGPPRLSLQGNPWWARCSRRRRPAPGPLQVRRQAGFVVPRRATIQPRTLEPDPVYSSRLVTQVINKVMTRGKKSTAEAIVYGAMDKIGERTGKPPVEVLEQAIKTVTPVLEVRSRRVGGANYQVPVEVPQRRARTLAVRWIVTYARDRREKHMSDKLAGEILDALEQQGGAYKRKDDLYRMAQANKAFAHYRW